MPDDKAARELLWFCAAVLSAGAGVVSYRDGAGVTGLLLLAAAGLCLGMFATGARLRLGPRTDGRPHPDDDWFREHPWWKPDPDAPKRDTPGDGLPPPS